MSRWPLHKAYFWETAPFFRILLPIVVGILFYHYSPATFINKAFPYCASLLAITAIVFLFTAFKKGDNTTLRSLRLLSFITSFILFAWSACYFTDIRNNDQWFGNYTSNANAFVARITQAPIAKTKTWKLTVNAINAVQDNHITPTSGKAFVYVYKEDSASTLHNGDTILLPNKWQHITNPGNPFEFDYAAYCARNNIYYSQFLPASKVALYTHGTPGDQSITSKVHDWCMQQLAAHIHDSATLGLIQSMLLGDDANLDPHIQQAYAATGIVHIIAISGGNVLIFFFMVSYLLWWIKDKRYQWVKYLVALPLIWFYVMMAGAPPSAIRAAAMFTLLSLGFTLQKDKNTLNILLATATLLLLANPAWLFSVGFQLSFVAVLSLILFYRPVRNILYPSSYLLRKLWDVTAASIAAEILIAPLVIYHFHSFPILFIVANALAYLFMSVILVLGMAVVLLSFIPVVANILGMLCVILVTGFDALIFPLQQFNPTSFHFLSISGIELLLLYSTIAGIMVFLIKQKKAGLFISLAACCLLIVSLCRDKWFALHQQRLVVYNINHAARVELISGDHYSILYTDSIPPTSASYALAPAHTSWHAWQQQSGNTTHIISIGNKTALIWDGAAHYTTAHFHVDYLIVTSHLHSDPEQLVNTYTPSMVVLSSGHSRKEIDKWLKTSDNTGVPVYPVAYKGAFVLDAF